jgi:hypothetical protein
LLVDGFVARNLENLSLDRVEVSKDYRIRDSSWS